MTAGLGALDDEDVDSGIDLTDGVFLGPYQGGDRNPARLSHFDHRRRRHAQRIGDQPDRMFEGRLEHPHRPVGIEGLGLIVGNGRSDNLDAEAFHQVAGEVAMGLRHPGPEAVVGDAGLPSGGHVLGDQDVQPVGFAPHLVVDPGKFPPHRFRRVAGRAQDAEAAGLAHRRHNVAAVAEGKEGKLDPQHVADRRFHGALPFSGGTITIGAPIHLWEGRTETARRRPRRAERRCSLASD